MLLVGSNTLQDVTIYTNISCAKRFWYTQELKGLHVYPNYESWSYLKIRDAKSIWS